MIIFRFSSLALLAILVGCSPAPVDPKEEAVSNAREAILLMLKDPNSAEFRQVEMGSKGSVCGLVNAKNSFGGFSGFSAFYYKIQTSEAYIHDSNQDWGGKGIDAEVFAEQGCTIGSEQAKALEVRHLLNESNERVLAK
jgi:hypothetical protein